MSKSDSPPPYQSTTADNTTSTPTPQTQTTTQRIHTRLTTIRTQYINDTITDHILPIIDRRASSGLNRTSIALIPLPDSTNTDTNTDTPRVKVLDIVSGGGDDDDDELEKVQLTHPIATLGFWSQDMVIAQLRDALLEKLRSGDGSVKGRGLLVKSESPSATVSVSSSQSISMQSTGAKSRSRGFFSRRGSSRQEKSGCGFSSSGVPGSESISCEPVTVDVRSDEICLRTVSVFGLYETMTRPALIVRIVIQT